MTRELFEVAAWPEKTLLLEALDEKALSLDEVEVLASHHDPRVLVRVAAYPGVSAAARTLAVQTYFEKLETMPSLWADKIIVEDIPENVRTVLSPFVS